MRIAVLGPLEVLTDDSVPVPLPGPTERSLLAVLAAGAPGVVAVDDLLPFLPGGDEPAEEALRTSLGRLRRALEPGLPARSSGQFVLRRGAGYALTLGRSDVDALRFATLVARGRTALAAGDPAEAERLLTAALALWRGEPYAEWPGAAFAERERSRLTALRADAAAAREEARARVRELPAQPADRPAPQPAYRPPVAPPIEQTRVPPRQAEAPPGEAPGNAAPVPDVPEVLGVGPRPLVARSRTRRAVLVGALVAALIGAVLVVRTQRDVVEPTTASAPDGGAERAATIVARQDPLDISVLIAVATVRTEGTPAARTRLLDVLGRLGRVQRVAPFTGIPVGPVLSGGESLTFRNDRTVLEWTGASGTQPRVLMGVPGEWGAWLLSAPSPVEPVILTAGENLDGPWLRSVSTIDGTSRLLASGEELGGRPVEAAVTPDGRRVRLLLGDPSDAIRWRVVEVDVADGAVHRTGPAGVIPAVADALAGDFSDDAATLVVWDVTRAEPATSIDVASGRRTPVAAPPNPASTTGYRALPSGVARLWDDGTVTLVGTGQGRVQELDAHDGQVRDVVLSPAGGWAVTAGDGSEVVRWDVDTETGIWSRPQPLTGHAGSVVGVETDRNGSTLFTVSLDNRVIAWDMRDRGGIQQDRARRLPFLDDAAQLAEACAVVGRDLTPAEWRTYLPGAEYRPTCSDLP